MTVHNVSFINLGRQSKEVAKNDQFRITTRKPIRKIGKY